MDRAVTSDDNPGTAAVELVGRDLGEARAAALRVLADEDRPAVRSAAFRALALVRREHGEQVQARMLLRRAWVEARRSGAWVEAGLARGGLDGLKALHEPLGSRHPLAERADAHGHLRDGVMEARRGEFRVARHAFATALRSAPDPQVRIAALLGGGEAQLAAGARADAAEQLEHALALAQHHALHYLIALVHQNLGCLASRAGDPDAAMAAFDAAAPFLRGMRAMGLAVDRAEALADAGLTVAARTVLARNINSPHAERIAALWARAQTALGRGDTRNALRDARRLRELSPLGPWVEERVARRAFTQRPHPVPLSPSFRPALANPQAVLVRFRRAWLRGHGGHGAQPAAPALRAELTRLGRLLHDCYHLACSGEAAQSCDIAARPPVVRYRRVGTDIHRDVVHETLVRTELVGSVARVRATVAALRAAAWRLATAPTRRAAMDLVVLAEPVLPRSLPLPAGLPVSIVPHGVLWRVPWGMLPRLREREVCVLPRTVPACSRVASASTDVALVAGPTRVGAAEVHQLAALYPRARTLTDAQAASTGVSDVLSRCRLVHIAGHGVAGYHRMGGGILLADGPLTGYDLWVAETLPEILVLSACGPAGSTPLGLPLAGLRHGATYVIASVLPVDDAALPAAMLAAHSALRGGAPPPRVVAEHLAHLGFVAFART